MVEIQIRSVPPELKAQVKERAAREGLTMSQYVLRLIEADLRLPTMEQWWADLAQDEPVDLGRPAREIIEEVRRERDRRLLGGD